MTGWPGDRRRGLFDPLEFRAPRAVGRRVHRARSLHHRRLLLQHPSGCRPGRTSARRRLRSCRRCSCRRRARPHRGLLARTVAASCWVSAGSSLVPASVRRCGVVRHCWSSCRSGPGVFLIAATPPVAESDAGSVAPAVVVAGRQRRTVLCASVASIVPSRPSGPCRRRWTDRVGSPRSAGDALASSPLPRFSFRRIHAQASRALDARYERGSCGSRRASRGCGRQRSGGVAAATARGARTERRGADASEALDETRRPRRARTELCGL